MPGSVRGAAGNSRPYRDHRCPKVSSDPFAILLKSVLAVMDNPRALDLIHVSAPKTIRAT